MNLFKQQGWNDNKIPMRMSKGSIVQMRNYDENHFLYFDLVDDWLSKADFPFLFDWRLEDDGTFRVFTPGEIE